VGLTKIQKKSIIWIYILCLSICLSVICLSVLITIQMILQRRFTEGSKKKNLARKKCFYIKICEFLSFTVIKKFGD